MRRAGERGVATLVRSELLGQLAGSPVAETFGLAAVLTSRRVWHVCAVGLVAYALYLRPRNARNPAAFQFHCACV